MLRPLRLHAIVIQLRRRLDHRRQRLVRRQIVHRRQTPEAAHAGERPFDEAAIDEQRVLPEAKGAVGLEGRHPAEHALVVEVDVAPLDVLFDTRTRGMYELPQVPQDRLRKRLRSGDICVDARVGHPPSLLTFG